MDEHDEDYGDVTIVNADGSDVTATDVLRAIANSQPAPCIGCAVRNLQVMGFVMPGDPVSPEEAHALR